MLSELDASEGLALFTDGSAWYKDRCGAWAYVIVDAFGHEFDHANRVEDTTSARMELQAWIEGLTTIYEAFGPSEILVFSDSQYVGFGATDRRRRRVHNKDLWEQLDQVIDNHTYVEFQHVRGHTGNRYNELVDHLASDTRKGRI